MTESNTFDVDQKYLTKLDAVKTKGKNFVI
jgi:hypothetical protein